MNAPPAALAAITLVLSVAACSKDPAATQIESLAAARGAPIVANSVCDRHILKPEDAAGMLSAPIIGTKPLPGDAQSCEFTTATFPALIISVRPGLGRTTVDAWKAGKMPLESSVLPGVGDAAVWVEPLHEVVAEKNAILCDIQIRGGGSDLSLNGEALSAAAGALCNKIFAAY
jgi:hypothetical protein